QRSRCEFASLARADVPRRHFATRIAGQPPRSGTMATTITSNQLAHGAKRATERSRFVVLRWVNKGAREPALFNKTNPHHPPHHAWAVRNCYSSPPPS